MSDLDDYTLFSDSVAFDADGTAKITVPSGRYVVLGEIDDTTVGEERAVLAGNAELTVDDDLTLPLDASHAQPLRISAPGMTPDPTRHRACRSSGASATTPGSPPCTASAARRPSTRSRSPPYVPAPYGRTCSPG